MSKQPKRHSSRLSVRDLEGCIHPANITVYGDAVDSDIGKPIEYESDFYTIFGSHDFLNDRGFPQQDEESTSTFAKKVSTNKRNPLYYVRGSSDGHFYDPLGMYDERKHNKFKGHHGKFHFDYIEVNERTFNFYLNYLKTKNKAYLLNAEREAF